MKERWTILLIMFLMALLGCRKDPDILNQEPEPEPQDSIPGIEYCQSTAIDISSFDTIFSDPYIAAYPGSWWEYSDGSSVTCEWAKYPLRSYTVFEQPAGHMCADYVIDTVYVPKLVGDVSMFHWGSTFVYDNKFLENLTYCYQFSNFSATKTFYLTQIYKPGADWGSYPCVIQPGTGTCDYYGTREILEVLDSLVLPNDVTYYDVLHIRETAVLYQDPGFETATGHIYYSKKFGIIQQNDHCFSLGGSYRYLTNCYIAPEKSKSLVVLSLPHESLRVVNANQSFIHTFARPIKLGLANQLS